MASTTLGLGLSNTALVKTSSVQMELHGARCSFCGLGEGQVARLFEGRSRYICNECIQVCAVLISDYRLLGYNPPRQIIPWYRRWFGSNSGGVISCSFCGTEHVKGEYLMAGHHSQICERCIQACESINYDALLQV